MKRKLICAAALCAVLLSGCSGTGDPSAVSAAAGASGSSAASLAESAASSAAQQSKPAQSSQSGAPDIFAPDFSDPPEPASSEPGDDRPSQPTVQDPPVISEGAQRTDSLSVESGTTAYLGGSDNDFASDTVVLEQDGQFDVSGTLRIAEGCELVVEGTLNIDGEIVLEKGSALTLYSDGSELTGSGSIRVEGSFDSIACASGIVSAAIEIIPPEREIIDGVTYVGGIVIANKAIKLTPEFGDHLYPDAVESWVQDALDEMNEYSYDEIGHIYANLSGYRSYYSQQAIFANYASIYGEEEADTFSSRAGHSEHQTGLTMDLDSFVESYIETTAGQWLADNCWRFGFIIRYPKGMDDITGYTYEPWHVRYVGKNVAKLVYDRGLTLEDFLRVEGGKKIID